MTNARSGPTAVYLENFHETLCMLVNKYRQRQQTQRHTQCRSRHNRLALLQTYKHDRGIRALHRFELLICVHSTDRYPMKASVQASPHGPVYNRASACRKGLSRWEPYRHAATSWEQPRVLSFGCLLTAATLSHRGMSDAAAGFAPGALSVDAGIPKAPLLASIV